MVSAIYCWENVPSYRIAVNFRGWKLSRIGEKYDIRGENFRKLLAFAAAAKDATPPNFAEKTFAKCHKNFLPRKLPAQKLPTYASVVAPFYIYRNEDDGSHIFYSTAFIHRYHSTCKL